MSDYERALKRIDVPEDMPKADEWRLWAGSWGAVLQELTR